MQILAPQSYSFRFISRQPEMDDTICGRDRTHVSQFSIPVHEYCYLTNPTQVWHLNSILSISKVSKPSVKVSRFCAISSSGIVALLSRLLNLSPFENAPFIRTRLDANRSYIGKQPIIHIK